MLYRRGASIVDAIYLDGSERARASVLALPLAAYCFWDASGPDHFRLYAPSGRIAAHPGQWLTYHRPTGTARTFSPERFHAEHEAC